METKEKEILDETVDETKEDAETVNEEEKDLTQDTPENPEDETEKASQEETDDAEANPEEGEKKKLFGKKNKKDPRDEKIEELEDRVKRQMAEFENFRKRTDKEKSSMYEMGAKAVIEKILPIIDNFERGLANVPENETNGFSDGMKMIYKQLLTELDNLGVKPIEAVGKEFDPNIHNAVMQAESEEYESGIVASELQKGYMYRETLVRPSMVSVVQ